MPQTDLTKPEEKLSHHLRKEGDHAVKKSDGSRGVRGHFRRVNTVTQLDRYPLPTLSSFNERLAVCTVFSKVDLIIIIIIIITLFYKA